MKSKKKSAKAEFRKVLARRNVFSLKLAQDNAGNPAFKKCENFCKNDYMVQEEADYKKSDEESGIPYKPMRPDFYQSRLNGCKNTFCNPKCEGLNRRLHYTRRIKDGWLEPEYTPKIRKSLAKKNALSGCSFDFYSQRLGDRKSS